MFTLDKIKSYSSLIRLEYYSGYMLCFFPACFGLLISQNDRYLVKNSFLFFICSIITRGAGCVVNDILDKNFDRYIARTKNRPLVAGLVSLREAYIIAAILFSISFYILLTFESLTVYLGCIAFLMILIYPLMKRIIKVPQLFLGLTFNFGVLIGSSVMDKKITFASILMYLSCCFWTIGYDTIYGFMDIDDDKSVGIKSLAILLETKNYKLYIATFYTVFILLFLLANLISNKNINLLVVSVVYFILIQQAKTLDIACVVNCYQRFKSNTIVGFLLILCYLI